MRLVRYLPIAVSILFALTAGMSLWATPTSSPLPPGGVLAANHYFEVTEILRGRLTIDTLRIFNLYTAALKMALGLEIIVALKLAIITVYAFLPIAAYLIGLLILRCRGSAIVASGAMAFYPALASALFTGDYNLVMGTLIVTLLLFFTVRAVLENGSLAAAVVLAMITPFADLRFAIVTVFILALWMLLYLSGERENFAKLLAVALSLMAMTLIFFSVNSQHPEQAPYLNLSYFHEIGVTILILTLVSAVIGTLVLVLDRLNMALFLLLTWAIIPIIASYLWQKETYLISIPALLFLATTPLRCFRRSHRINKVSNLSEEPVMEVEIDLEKALAIALPIILTLSAFTSFIPRIGCLQGETTLTPERIDQDLTSKINQLLREGVNPRELQFISSIWKMRQPPGFLLADDFGMNTVDIGIWNRVYTSGSSTVVNGVLNMTLTGGGAGIGTREGVISSYSFMTPLIMEIDFKATSIPTEDFTIGISFNELYKIDYQFHNRHWRFRMWDSEDMAPYAWIPDTNWHNLKIVIESIIIESKTSTAFLLLLDGTTIGFRFSDITHQNGQLALNLASYNSISTLTVLWDDVKVYKP
jgi:hypothetical protein